MVSQQESGSTSEPATDEQKKTSARTKSRRRIILVLITLLLIAGATLYWFLHRFDEDTDDAYTQGRIIAIVPHVSGYATDLLVNDNQFVHAGQELIRIDQRDWIAARDQAAASVRRAEAAVDTYRLQQAIARKRFPAQLDEARGQLGQARADEFKARTDYRRQHSIMRAATSEQDIDYSKAALDMAVARVLTAQAQVTASEPVEENIGSTVAQTSQQEADLASARAQLVRAELNLEWTVIRAPVDGWISQRNIEKGNYVSTGQKLMAITSPEVWVVANFKETQITRIRPGQQADISVDAYPSHSLKGHVDSLQKGSGAAFSAFPPENATGNFVKIVQRVPVKILIDSGLDPDVPLALGLSVVPTVHTDTTPSHHGNDSAP
ncbi:HlyD family secretion protein [Acetobacter sp. AN02]|uniref:HlyD family secretion protein n=1 Tax=Acetobacter sp. AN02 TaxID=2894186 RepID=UPI0024342711|nr:HlyD family secretion protein [Acetobacter sp. AN02]MDG6094451.1 HlyD family secretion protein [Acetobacter sp. AN02]